MRTAGGERLPSPLAEPADLSHAQASAARTAAATHSVLVDDRADILAFQRAGQVAAPESVDDLDLGAEAGAGQVLDDHALDDEVGQIAVQERARSDAPDERRARPLLGVVLVEAVLVLDEQTAARAQHLGR